MKVWDTLHVYLDWHLKVQHKIYDTVSYLSSTLYDLIKLQDNAKQYVDAPRRNSLHNVGMMQRSAQIVSTQSLLPERGA